VSKTRTLSLAVLALALAAPLFAADLAAVPGATSSAVASPSPAICQPASQQDAALLPGGPPAPLPMIPYSCINVCAGNNVKCRQTCPTCNCADIYKKCIAACEGGT
jgi:hypothetical protein